MVQRVCQVADRKSLKEHGLSIIPVETLIDTLDSNYGGDFLTGFREELKNYTDLFVAPAFNTPERAWELVENVCKKLLCFSLSERMDSAPMWAHYADNNQGFVIAFDAKHEWFQRRSDGKQTRLQKVAYFDGKITEPLENLQSALISKTTDWEYECEWRLYAQEEQVDKIVGNQTEPIHLIHFPPTIVDRVILGPKTKSDVSGRIHAIMASQYPNARLVRAVANRQAHTYDEVAE